MARENLARPIRPFADEQGRRVLADDEVEVGVVGHAVAFVRRPFDLDHAAVRIPAAAHVAGHVRKQQEMIDRMPDRPLGEDAVRRHLDGRRVELDQLLELRPQRRMAHRFRFLPMTTTQPQTVKRAARHAAGALRLSLRRVAENVGC